jgi:hypothetical protein
MSDIFDPFGPATHRLFQMYLQKKSDEADKAPINPDWIVDPTAGGMGIVGSIAKKAAMEAGEAIAPALKSRILDLIGGEVTAPIKAGVESTKDLSKASRLDALLNTIKKYKGNIQSESDIPTLQDANLKLAKDFPEEYSKLPGNTPPNLDNPISQTGATTGPYEFKDPEGAKDIDLREFQDWQTSRNGLQYHGTSALENGKEFTHMKKSPAGYMDSGVYMSKDPEHAGTFARGPNVNDISDRNNALKALQQSQEDEKTRIIYDDKYIGDPDSMSKDLEKLNSSHQKEMQEFNKDYGPPQQAGGGRIIPLKTNALMFDLENPRHSSLLSKHPKEYPNMGDIAKEAKDLGFDGMKSGNTSVVFDPNKVKFKLGAAATTATPLLKAMSTPKEEEPEM